jgi:hypothetical protein
VPTFANCSISNTFQKLVLRSSFLCDNKYRRPRPVSKKSVAFEQAQEHASEAASSPNHPGRLRKLKSAK